MLRALGLLLAGSLGTVSGQLGECTASDESGFDYEVGDCKADCELLILSGVPFLLASVPTARLLSGRGGSRWTRVSYIWLLFGYGKRSS